MTGLFLLLVLGLWAGLSWWLAGRLARGLANGLVRRAARVAIVVCMLPLPLADEIYSLSAVRRLCLANADIVVSADNLSGKTVWFTGVTRTARKAGVLQGMETRSYFVLPDTEAPAFQYTSFAVEGGWLMRTLGLSQTPAPMLFEAHCGPTNLGDQRRRLNVTVLDKPN